MWIPWWCWQRERKGPSERWRRKEQKLPAVPTGAVVGASDQWTVRLLRSCDNWKEEERKWGQAKKKIREREEGRWEREKRGDWWTMDRFLVLLGFLQVYGKKKKAGRRE